MSDTIQVRPGRAPADGSLLSIVYASTATVPFSDVDLALLLAGSRIRNDERGLSGLLLYRNGQFMQVLEGPEPAVRALLATIAEDPRHSGVRALHEERIDDRRFGSWAMGYRSISETEPPSWFGSPEALRQRDFSHAGELLAWFRDS